MAVDRTPFLTRRTALAAVGGALAAPALYTAGPARANARPLGERLASLRIGQMRKLTPLDAPVAMPDTVFFRADGSETTLAAWHGRAVMLNFWATWCAPCIKELPSIDRLVTKLEEEGVADRTAVLTINVDQRRDDRPQKMFDRIGVERLELLKDPAGGLPRALGIRAMPTSYILDAKGQRVAELIGDAEWDSAEAVAVMRAAAEAAAA